MTGNSDQFAKYTIDLGVGSYLASLLDFGTPADFSYLRLVLTEGVNTFVDTGNIKPADVSNTPFNVDSGHAGTFTAIVYGRPGVDKGFFGSQYHFEIDAIPEPGIWLMMAGGIVLLGWLRVRKSESIG